MNPTRQQLRAQARINEFREVTAQFPAEPRRVRRTIARKRARTRWARLVVALATFAAVATIGAIAPPEARAQGSRKDDIVFNTRGVPLAGASVRVCAMPATGQPCTPLALIYSDAALTQALANPLSTDGLGNYFFFAAPGKYLIEISGPGIITKQFPNVILPSDPTSPTFSSITTTSGITGFSLTLTGSLTVNGSASVVGNLGFGSAQLTNQATPPGAAPTGTVNLYTKTADKRLYYKDDTGTEIGPIANTTGAQTNVTNTFTADQNIDSNLRVKGPSPWIDVTRPPYSMRALANPPQSTTATCTSGSLNVSLPGGAIDFVTGDGIVIHKCGASSRTTLGVPNQPGIATIVRSSNVVTVTTDTPTNGFATGNTVTIAGVGDASFNGTFTPITSTGANIFTYAQVAANASSTGGTATNTVGTLTATPKGLTGGATTYNYQIIAENANGALTAASPIATTTTGPATLGQNTLNIVNVSRTAGVMTVTTTAAHNMEPLAQVKLNTNSAVNFDGAFTVLATPTSTTFTINQIGAPDVAAVSGGTVNVAAYIRMAADELAGGTRFRRISSS